jgi:hypothetical protein
MAGNVTRYLVYYDNGILSGRDFRMHTDSPLAVIADASRLGGQLLKKILDPVIESELCNSDAALMAALRNAPPVFMLSHDWPDLVGTIERIRLQAPRARLILLVSADNRLEDESLLQHDEVIGTLTRPYQARDVINLIVRALRAGLATPETSQQVVVQDNPTAPLHSVLERDIAFCKRHGLMLSAMAVQLNDYQKLCQDIGNDIVVNAQQTLELKMRALLRHEDSICLRQPGLLILSLPGTPPMGARVLAHRICAWLDHEEIRQQHFNIHFSVNIGIHCCIPGSDVDIKDFLAATSFAAEDIASTGESHIRFSEYAQSITGQGRSSAQQNQRIDSEHFWQTFETLLRHPKIIDGAHQDALLEKIAPILATLPEQQRLRLVDDLLSASITQGG